MDALAFNKSEQDRPSVAALFYLLDATQGLGQFLAVELLGWDIALVSSFFDAYAFMRRCLHGRA